MHPSLCASVSPWLPPRAPLGTPRRNPWKPLAKTSPKPLVHRKHRTRYDRGFTIDSARCRAACEEIDGRSGTYISNVDGVVVRRPPKAERTQAVSARPDA